MHYNILVFSIPTYVSALIVPFSGVSSIVHNLHDTPDDGTGSAETYVRTENTKIV
jgi:hypothetical protein